MAKYNKYFFRQMCIFELDCKKKGKCLSEFPWYAYAFLVSTGYLKICAVQMKRLVGNSRTVCS